MVQTFPNPTCEDFFSCIRYIFGLTDTGQGAVAGIVILIVIAGALFMSMKGFGTKVAMGVAGLSLGIFAILFRTLNWINDAVLTICIILSAAGIWLLLKGQSQYDS